MPSPQTMLRLLTLVVERGGKGKETRKGKGIKSEGMMDEVKKVITFLNN